MRETKPRVIAFLSGKGGSGKTTTAIAIAKLLADMGFKTLLIDFDLATNGASYFFKSHFPRNAEGVWEYLAAQREEEADPFQVVDELPIKVEENLFFVASRINLNRKGNSYDAVTYEDNALQQELLGPLIKLAWNLDIAYVLIDCQAGYAISSSSAAKVSERAIIVTEADAISSDAAENLLIQMGQNLPDDRRYLVNKIDVRDAETYRNMRHVFQAMNRLPPLPFDFNVRNAFGARQIPVDVNKPSPLLFALFETLKYAFPEINNMLDTYKEKHIKDLFSEYDEKLQELLSKKEDLEQKRLRIRSIEPINSLSRYYIASVAGGFMPLIYIFSISNKHDWDFNIKTQLSMRVLLGMFVAVSAYNGLLKSKIQFNPYKILRGADTNGSESDISYKIDSINEELAQIRSLLWTRSKEYLIEAELSKPHEFVGSK